MKLSGLLIAGALLATTGCRFEHKSNGDKNDKVKFETPFGGMSVKTDQKSALAGVGLTPYPGAVLNTKGNGDHEDGAADVNMSFGSFHFGVKALSYQSSDAPDKVLAFYRQDMAKYGTVILCHGHSSVGQPTRTQDGLTCDSEGKKTKTIQINTGDSNAEDELRAGSPQHQHIASVQAHSGGTKIGLVMLDLPGTLGDEDSKE